MKKFNAPFKVKSTTTEEHEKNVGLFREMMDTWKHTKMNREYEMVEDNENLIIEIIAKIK